MVKLNVGCGWRYKRGWVNIDPYDGNDPAPDIVAALPDLPFPDGHADIVFCSHAIEHIPLHVTPAAIRELHRVARSGGKVVIVAPDYLDMPSRNYDDTIRTAVFGGEKYPGDEHQWACSTPLLGYLLQVAGIGEFTRIELRRNREFANNYGIRDRERYGQCCFAWTKQ